MSCAKVDSGREPRKGTASWGEEEEEEEDDAAVTNVELVDISPPAFAVLVPSSQKCVKP